MDSSTANAMIAVGTVVMAVCMVLTRLYKIIAFLSKSQPALLNNCWTNIIKLLRKCSLKLSCKSLIKFLRNCSLKLQRNSLIQFLRNCSLKLQRNSLMQFLRKSLLKLQSKCSLELLFKGARILAIGFAVATLAVYAATIASNINTVQEKLVQSMITQVTDITKKNEKRTQDNIEDMLLKFVSSIAPPGFQDETIKEALARASYNGYIFDIALDNTGTHNFFMSRRWLDRRSRPLLLTERERELIMSLISDEALNQDLMTLMRTILDDETIMGNLKYDFPLDSEEIHLSHYDKLGIIAGYINMLKAERKDA